MATLNLKKLWYNIQGGKIQKTLGKKLHNLFFNNYYDNSVTSQDADLFFNNYYDNSVTSQDADRVSFNFPSNLLTDHEKSSLSKGLHFAIQPENISYADCLLPFE